MIDSFDIFRKEVFRLKKQHNTLKTKHCSNLGRRWWKVVQHVALWYSMRFCTNKSNLHSLADKIFVVKIKQIHTASRCGFWCFKINKDRLCRVIWSGFCVTAWCQQQLPNTYEDKGEQHRNMKNVYLHHMHQLWFVGTICVGLHPKKEDSPPTKCKGSHLTNTQE